MKNYLTQNVDILISEEQQDFLHFFKLFLDSSINWETFRDKDGRIIYSNNGIEEIVGYTSEQYKSGAITFEEIVHPDDAHRILDVLKTAIKGISFRELNFRLIHVNGQVRYVSLSSNPVYDDGRYLGMRSSVVDLTKTISADKEKSNFLAKMSHEFRTPLNAILGFAQLLQLSEDDLTDQHVDYVKLIEQSGKHLLHLVNELQDISKIEAGKMVINNDLFNLKAMVTLSVESIKPLASKKNIEISIDFDNTIVEYYGDSLRIKQVLINLLSNGVKYSKNDKKIHLLIKRFENRLIVKVTDEGIGIDEKYFDDIFNPFKQIDNELNNEESSGLGLSITKHIVELHGGNIMVESELNNGSIFTVNLPIVIE